MLLDPPLQPVILLRRYKRFLADVRWPDGTEMTVHTPNTGAMLGCAVAGRRVWLRDTHNPKRKYRYSWEISEGTSGALIGVNTGIVNALVSEAIQGGVVAELEGYTAIRQEVGYGEEGSRIDLLLSGHASAPDCHLEIKSVTARDPTGCAIFPDAVSVRATKHLRELSRVVVGGGRAVIFFCVQRGDVTAVRPADEIDPHYGRTLREALAVGVEALAYRATVTPQAIIIDTPLAVVGMADSVV